MHGSTSRGRRLPAARGIHGFITMWALSSAPHLGCGGPETHFSLAFESAHFRYHVADGVAPPCADTAQWLERDYQAFAEFLGVPDTRNVKIDYFLYGSQAAVSQHCSDGGIACADGSSVHASLPVLDHELVHAIASFVGDPPFLFQEGLADMIAGTGRDVPGQRIEISEPLELLITTGAFADWIRVNGFHIYPTAAKLLRMLCDRFGTATFMAFYASVPVSANAFAISEAARLHFGASIESLIADLRALPPTYPDENRRHLMPCHDAPLVSGAQAAVPLVCARSGVGSEAIVPFTAGAGPTELLFDGSVVQIELARCDGGTLTGLPLKVAPADPDPQGARVVLDVPPGEYYAEVRAFNPVPMTVRAVPTAVTLDRDACHGARGAIELSADYPVILATRWRTEACIGAPWCPGLAWDILPTTDGTVGVNGLVDELPKDLFSCQAACPADLTAGCPAQPLAAAGAPAKLPAIAASPLHVGADDSPNDRFFALLLQLFPR
jgi:hypothetical protein